MVDFEDNGIPEEDEKAANECALAFFIREEIDSALDFLSVDRLSRVQSFIESLLTEEEKNDLRE